MFRLSTLLAQLHSDAVDYPKSGEPVKLEQVRKLLPKLKPDWSAPETNTGQSARYYPSQSSVGRLFRDVELPPTQLWTMDAAAAAIIKEVHLMYKSTNMKQALLFLFPNMSFTRSTQLCTNGSGRTVGSAKKQPR